MFATFTRLILAVSLLTGSLNAWAETQVRPGHNTLRDAIVAASEGDTLVLLTGVYTGDDAVNIEKSLTIRAATSQAPIISKMNLAFFSHLNNDQIINRKVTIQGLKFIGEKYTPNGYLVLGANKNIVVNNEFINYRVISEINSQIIGNTFSGSNRNGAHWSSTTFNQLAVTGDEAYIASNTFDTFESTTSADQIKVSARHAYIVGNFFDIYSKSQLTSAMLFDGETSFTVANRVKFLSREAVDYTSLDIRLFKLFGSTSNSIQNNLFDLDFTIAMNASPNRFSAIEASNLSNIHNNVVYVSGTMLEPTAEIHRGAILITGIEANSNVYGNIVQNYKGKAIKTEANNAHVNISHNLCHNNTDNSACSAANNGVIGDPKFVNTIGFALDVGSPAIDAGFTTDYFDIDGSIQDIGIHGGPWGFDFYQSQLSDNTKPYLFPYFDQISLTSSGKVDINVLSVARFK